MLEEIFEIIFWISLFLIFYHYIFYFLILKIWASLFSKKHKINENIFPTVSVIVSAYNEEKVLEKKIKNLLTYDYPQDKIEFLFGSDGSNDKTNEILKNVSLSNFYFYELEKRRGKSSVINDLVRNANGEILIFSDANTIFQSDAIKKIVRHFNDNSIGGVCGKLVLKYKKNNIGGSSESTYWNYENKIKELESKIYTTFGANGAIYAIRKNFFLQVPTNIFIVDDFVIPLSIVSRDIRVIFDKEVFAFEETTESTQKEFQRKVRIASRNFSSIFYLSHLLNPKYGFISFGLISHKIIRWIIPFFLIVIFVSNIFLLAIKSDIYLLFFLMQIGFYFFALIGLFLDKINFQIKIFTLPYYFIIVNFGLFLGFIKYVSSKSSPMWEKT